MRFAAIADVHGNYLALEAVIADIRAQGIDEIVDLGDMASGPLDARRTMDILMALDAVHIRGNHDRWLIDTPADDNTYWLETILSDGTVRMSPIEAIEPAAARITQSLILCAHTHIARAVRLGDGRLIVNPGSVGSPGYRDIHPSPHVVEAGTPDARYAILEWVDDAWRVTFRHVPYDHDTMAALARRNGHPELASALATGWIR